MNISKRHLFFNKYLVFTFSLIIIFSFFSWAIFSEFFSALFIWDTSPYTKKEYINIIYSFSTYAVDGFALLQLIFPIFAVIIVLPFLNIKKLMILSYTRIKSYKKILLKNILKYLFVGCTVLFLSYLIFLIIGTLFLPMSKDVGVPRELFSEILGKNFYNQHMFSYFVIEGFIKYFVFSFVYGLFAIAISFFTQKKYLSMLIPISYYSILSIVIGVLESAFHINILFLSPSYTLMSNARPYINGFAIIAPLIPVLIFSIIIIVRDLTNKNKRNDVFGVT